ncbi:MAG TPA: hypothetical protein PKA88_07615 [Polyangiaceae bacterium]|nr:hypothetical protein [Polyangiaceae bacterium]HMR73842.1 hypothetical protein [Polyangiaceae bacterium]
MRRACSVCLLLLGMGACFQLPDPEAEKERCAAICDHTASCPNLDGGATCVDRCLASHFPEACAEAITAASCAVLEQGATSTASWAAACYPRCNPDGVACNGIRIMTCSAGRLAQMDCTFQCEEIGERFSGVCGATRNGKSSPTGRAQCWCDPK